MAIRIIERGNPATRIVDAQNFDECIIESTEQNFVSFVTYKKNGKIVDRQRVYDSDISEMIAETEFSKVAQENGDFVFYTRQLGEEELEVEEIPTSDDIIEI